MEVRILHCVDWPAVEPSCSVPGMRVVSPGAAPSPDTPLALLEILAWWEAKAAGALPHRSALDPVEIGRHLSCIALLDVEDGDFRFRLAGEEVQARYAPCAAGVSVSRSRATLGSRRSPSIMRAPQAGGRRSPGGPSRRPTAPTSDAIGVCCCPLARRSGRPPSWP